MFRNNLSDLNNHLFEQLERLNDSELDGDSLENEIKKSKVVSDIAKNIIEIGSLSLQAEKLKAEKGIGKNGVKFIDLLNNND